VARGVAALESVGGMSEAWVTAVTVMKARKGRVMGIGRGSLVGMRADSGMEMSSMEV
jgi:hypothetical protein